MKIAVIIGGYDGIGKSLAKAFESNDFEVYVGDIKAVDDIPQRTFHVDVTDITSINNCYARLSNQIAKIDAFVITVGCIDEGSILNIPLQKWKWVLSANFLGSVSLVDTFLPLIQNSDMGRILLTGSGSGFGEFESESKLGLYSICKHAHLAYFKVLASELGDKNIQVSLLVPAGIKGNLAKNSAQMRHENLSEKYFETGTQPEGRILLDADSVAVDFVSQFLAGKIIITNEPLKLKDKIENELVKLTSYLWLK